jgi:anhydro-N-acetylmuramic acid kinase
MDSQHTSTAELARLNWRLGAFYADCVETATQTSSITPQLIACHGQTIYHQAIASPYLARPTRTTWQLGEASVLAERLRLPVLSDFRAADLAAGGQGAPLVPMLDYTMFRHATKNRLLLNLGGIANITALPADCNTSGVLAFDTGPANMVIDALMNTLFNKPFDRNGATAKQGRVLDEVVANFLREPYFSAPPPKSCGREQFGAAFAARFLAACRRRKAAPQDIIATATALTSASITEAYARFCWPHLGQHAPNARATEMLLAGGGTRNATLLQQLTLSFAQFGIPVRTTDAFGLPSQAKEAAAFALLGWLTWHGLPGNIPAATGASRPVILGKVTHA